MTYALLLLYYPAWNPQYAPYLLPFPVLLWPGLRGVFYFRPRPGMARITSALGCKIPVPGGDSMAPAQAPPPLGGCLCRRIQPR